MSLIATTPGIGAGTALPRTIRTRAAEPGVDRLWLITTTNDNTDPLAFYQRFAPTSSNRATTRCAPHAT